MSTVPVKFSELTPEYTMHNAEIDEEHQFMSGLVNSLHDAMLAGRGAQILETLLAELTKFTLIHFANEEKLMAAVHYPEMPAHVQQHDQIRRRVTETEARFARGETAITVELMLFFSDWFRNHALVADRRLGDYVQVEQFFTTYLERLLQGDQKECGLIVQRLLAEGVSFENLYVGLFQRAMYHTGELWMKNKISVATEHLVTAITLSMMTLVHPLLLDSSRNGKTAVVTCVGGELHQVGGKMVSDMFELHGWDSYFLGGNTPVEGLLELIEEKQPEVLCLSVTLSSHIGQFKETVEKTRSRFPDLNILAGGQAFFHNSNEGNGDPRLSYLRSLYELETWIESR
jgi:hemerythrin-like metal-binding protein